MKSPDVLTKINQFLLLLPNFHNEQLKKEEEPKDGFNLLLEEFLNEKRRFLDTTNTLKMGKQIWQMVQEKNQETHNSQLEGIIEGEDKKRKYFSSLILSCLFPGKGDGGDHSSGDPQNINEKLFFYSSRYSSNQLGGGEEAPLRILKEAIGTLVGKKPEDGILEDFKEPEPMDFDLIKNDLFSKDPFFEEEVENDDQAQEEALKNQIEEGYSKEDETGQNKLADFFKSDDSSSQSKSGTGLEEKASQNAHHSLKDRQNLLFEKEGIEDLFSKEEEPFPDDSEDSGNKAFLANESSQGHTAKSFTNLQAEQATPSKFIREETEEEIARIISKIKLLKEAEQTEVRMELDLERLGKLKVKITKEDGDLQTDFLAENLEAKELIESNISALRDALLSLGFDSVNIKTTVDHQQGNNDFFRQRREKPSLAGLSYRSEEWIKDDDLPGEPSISWRGETISLVA